MLYYIHSRTITYTNIKRYTPIAGQTPWKNRTENVIIRLCARTHVKTATGGAAVRAHGIFFFLSVMLFQNFRTRRVNTPGATRPKTAFVRTVVPPRGKKSYRKYAETEGGKIVDTTISARAVTRDNLLFYRIHRYLPVAGNSCSGDHNARLLDRFHGCLPL